MAAHPRVIGYLQRALNHEFSAAQQYTLQAVQAEAWGLQSLATELREGVQEELRHAEVFIARMYAAGVTPHAGQPRAPRIGSSHADMLRSGLATEQDAIRLYREAGIFCQRSGDHENFAVFSRILADEEQHRQDLERQLVALGA
jgi:bacterioferritin